jgi:hypothetical protein
MVALSYRHILHGSDIRDIKKYIPPSPNVSTILLLTHSCLSLAALYKMPTTIHSARAQIPYRQLNPDEFRLLRIRPSCFGTNLQCDLFHASLDKPPPFEALSYVWGAPNPPSTLLCAGAHVPITKNLYEALCHFRDTSRSRIVWADALCINQTDNAEKSQQVARMREIYTKCERLLVWFGAPAPGVAENALKALKRFRGLFEKHADERMLRVLLVHEEAGAYMDEWEKRVLGELDVDRVLDKYWKALAAFFGCPWFSRVWIVQEAISAPGGSAPKMTLSYGDADFDWLTVAIVSGGLVAMRLVGRITKYMEDTDLNAFPWQLIVLMQKEREYNYFAAGFDVKDGSSQAVEFTRNCMLQAVAGVPNSALTEGTTPLLHQDRTRLQLNITLGESYEPGANFGNARNMTVGGIHSRFWAFLRLALGLNSTDPRDKIYAMLGLLEQDLRSEPVLQPDYTKSVVDLYTDVTRYFIEKEFCLDIWERTYDQPDQEGMGVPNLPSWVVDWSRRSILEPFHPTYADWGAGGTVLGGHVWTNHRPIISSDGRRLKLKAHFAGVIQWHVPPESEFDFSREDALAAQFGSGTSSLARDLLREFSRYRDCLIRAKTLETGLPPAVQHPDMAPPSKDVQYRITDESLYEAFWRTLICDLDLQGRKPDSSYAEVYECFCRFHDTWNGSFDFLGTAAAPHAYNEYQRFRRRYRFYGRERRFFTTSMKLMGWAPKRSQVGDHAVVFPGARLPYIIRWKGDAYELIGPAYVHGLMESLGTQSIDDILSSRASRIPSLNPACDIWLK